MSQEAVTDELDVRQRARRLRSEMTAAERRLWELLRARGWVRLKFRRQHPIGPYVADFYCHQLKLVLELDGDVHDQPSQKAHDKNRTANLSALSITVLRFSNEQVFRNPQTVLDEIARFLEAQREDDPSLLQLPLSPRERGSRGEGWGGAGTEE